MRHLSIFGVLVAVAGCTGASTTESSPPPSTGGEGETTVEAIEEPEPVPEPVAEPEPPPPPPLTPHDPVRCAGREEITLEGVEIDNASGAAIDANGRCVVRITRCRLQGSTFAIKANGQAEVDVSECAVGGTQGAVDARGTAKVRFVSSSVEGDVRRAGRATVEGHEAPAEPEE